MRSWRRPVRSCRCHRQPARTDLIATDPTAVRGCRTVAVQGSAVITLVGSGGDTTKVKGVGAAAGDARRQAQWPPTRTTAAASASNGQYCWVGGYGGCCGYCPCCPCCG